MSCYLPVGLNESSKQEHWPNLKAIPSEVLPTNTLSNTLHLIQVLRQRIKYSQITDHIALQNIIQFDGAHVHL